MGQKTIMLIQPKHDKEFFVDTLIYKPRPLCGLEYIAKVLEKEYPQTDIKIYDGEIIDEQKILKNLPHGGVVGLSDWFSNHKNVIKYARIAKELGNIVVLGGPNVTYMPHILLKKYPFIDYIILRDGEEAFKKLLSVPKFQLSRINNLCYRKEGLMLNNINRNVNLNKLPLFDFSHSVKLEKYYINSKDNWWTPIAGIRGCINATRYRRCVFCSLPTIGVRVQNPRIYWKQVKYLNKKYGINRFFETGDIFSVGNYPLKLAEAKPKELNVILGVHESVTSIDKKVYEKCAKNLGISEVFLGVEHVNKKILELNKNVSYDRNKIEEVISLLEKLEIKISLGLIWGLPGETRETAEENYSFLQEITKRHKNIYRASLSIVTPHRGTYLFDLLSKNPSAVKEYNNKKGRNLIDDDMLDINYLQNLNLKYNCKLEMDQLHKILNKAQKILPYTEHCKMPYKNYK